MFFPGACDHIKASGDSQSCCGTAEKTAFLWIQLQLSYYFHRNAEELFIILEGEATLRSPEGYQTISKGSIIFFEEGPYGAHQLYNHSDDPFIYLDLRTKANVDVCEYPDSKKINILPAMDIFEEGSKVSYYTGEEGVKDKWPKEIIR